MKFTAALAIQSPIESRLQEMQWRDSSARREKVRHRRPATFASRLIYAVLRSVLSAIVEAQTVLGSIALVFPCFFALAQHLSARDREPRL